MKIIKFSIISGFVLAAALVRGDGEVFINNNVVTNKLLSVEKFVNNGKFHISLEDQSNYNFFNLQTLENSGTIDSSSSQYAIDSLFGDQRYPS